MYENRVLREIFGSMREEVKGDYRKLHNENKKCGKMNSRITSGLQNCAANRCVMIILRDNTKQDDNFQTCKHTQ